jgi:hypothetical protein
MQYDSADVWADWNFDCTLQSVLNRGLSIAVTSADPPYIMRHGEGGNALDRLSGISGNKKNVINDSFSKIPWAE